MIRDEPLPVLWLCGPPGVGKTAVGWAVYTDLVRAGVQTGYVDIDQLGMCFPEPAGDPGRYRLKTRNLAGMVAGFRAAGARCLVVSGVIDARRGVDRADLPGVALTVCRLRAAAEDLTRRVVGRDGAGADVDHVLREAALLDAGAVAGPCVDTTGLPVAAAAREVRRLLGGWPGPGGDGAGGAGGPAADGAGARGEPAGPVLWLCGATGVGKSTVGFQVYLRVIGAGLPAGYVDLDQLGFCGPAPGGPGLTARNLAAVWRSYRQAGARALVMVGPAPDASTVDTHAAAVPAATLTVCRLHAGPDDLRDRILRRGRGEGSWAQPGDPLLGRPVAHLRRAAAAAARDADSLERAGLGHRIDTDGRTVEEVTDLVLAGTGWPPGVTGVGTPPARRTCDPRASLPPYGSPTRRH